MIDVNNIIDFNRSDEELEELILFLIAVAGKKADRTARQLTNWIDMGGVKTNPFAIIHIRNYVPVGKTETTLLRTLKEAGFGCYTRLEKAFAQIASSNINLRTCTKEDLMKIHGIGRKSASCFLAWTRKGEKVAMLDTHLLKYLKMVKLSYEDVLDYLWNKKKQRLLYMSTEPYRLYKLVENVDIPESTPSSKRVYDVLEEFYLGICKMKKVDPVEYDLEIWKYYSQGLDKKLQAGTIN